MGNCWANPLKTLHIPTPDPTRSSSPGASTGTSKGSRSSQFSQSIGGYSTKSIEAECPEGKILQTPNLRIFSFAELKAATRNFHPDVVLGEGGFGTVYKGWIDEKSRKSGNGKVIAVKKLNSESMQGFEEWQSEVDFLGRLYHPNLVRLLGYGWEDNELLLVYEYMPRGSLENHLFRRDASFQPLSWSIRLKIALGAAKGLAFLHTSEKKVIYRDFKASNILLDSFLQDYNAKISDFGLAKNGPLGSESHVTTRIIGTYGYAAPEYVATGHLYVKSDVYGFGVLLLEMLSGQRALDVSRPSGQHKLVDWAKPLLVERRKLVRLMDPRLEGKYTTKAAIHTAKLAHRCLEAELKNRPSMKEVVDALEEIQAMKDRPVDAKNPSPRPGNGNRRRHHRQLDIPSHSHCQPMEGGSDRRGLTHQTPPRLR